MNKTNSVLEVNGNRYDAMSGQLISAGSKVRQSTSNSKKKMIDGFVIGAHNTKKTIKKAAAKRTKNTAQGLHQTPQRPRTLMRTGLKKPLTQSGKPSVTPRHKAIDINPVRQLRARTVQKHAQVKRFGHFAQAKPAEVVRKTVDVQPRTAKSEVVASSAAVRMPSMISSVSQRKLESLLDEALLKADAHKQMLNQRSRRGIAGRVSLFPKWLSFGLVGFIIMVVLALLVWQNLPAVAMHVAASKSHVNASMPAYTPSGFSFVGPLHYSDGHISMVFKDKKAADRSFMLTQAASNWSSSSLEANALPKTGNIQTSEVNGTTVYIYGDKNDAMWVNHSVLYNLKNQADLTSDQVLRIVQGL